MQKETSMEIGIPELVIVLLVVVVVFGVGRVGRLGGEIGSAIRQFREGLKSDLPDTTPPSIPEQKG